MSFFSSSSSVVCPDLALACLARKPPPFFLPALLVFLALELILTRTNHQICQITMTLSIFQVKIMSLNSVFGLFCTVITPQSLRTQILLPELVSNMAAAL